MKKPLLAILFLLSIGSMAFVGPFPPGGSGSSSGGGSSISTPVSIPNGGTGQTTANSAFNALAPSQFSANGKYLTSDGTNTSWATIATTSPGGSDTYIQYNDAGSFGGSSLFTFTKTTGAILLTSLGTATRAFDINMLSATGNGQGFRLRQTFPSATGSGQALNVVTTSNTSSAPQNFHGIGVSSEITNGGGGTSTSGSYYIGTYSNVNPPNSSNTLSGYNNGSGNYGTFSTVAAGGTGSAMGAFAAAVQQNKGVGGEFFVFGGFGANAQSYGVRALATNQTSSGTGQAVGLLARIGTTGDSTFEGFDPGLSAGAVVDSGDTGKYALVAMNAGVAVMTVSGNGITTIGQVGTTSATHQINGTVVANSGSGTPAFSGGGSPVTGAPATWLKIQINGTNYVIPAWAAP